MEDSDDLSDSDSDEGAAGLPPQFDEAARDPSDSRPNGRGAKAATALDVQDIDAYWLQRTISKAIPGIEPQSAHEKSDLILRILGDTANTERDVENELVPIFEYSNFETVKLLMTNRWEIVWCTRLARSQGEVERAAIEKEMAADESLSRILSLLKASKTSAKDKESEAERRILAEARALKGSDPTSSDRGAAGAPSGFNKQYKHVDLQDIMFQQGSRLMVNKSCQLPEGSYRSSTKEYEEVGLSLPLSLSLSLSLSLKPSPLISFALIIDASIHLPLFLLFQQQQQQQLRYTCRH